MKDSPETTFERELFQACRGCAEDSRTLISIQNIHEVYLQVLTDPDAADKNEPFKPLVAYIRRAIQDGVPLTWFRPDRLKELFQSRLDKAREIMQQHFLRVAEIIIAEQKISCRSSIPDIELDMPPSGIADLLYYAVNTLQPSKQLQADNIAAIHYTINPVANQPGKAVLKATIYIQNEEIGKITVNQETILDVTSEE